MQSDSEELRKNLERLRNTTTGIYSFHWDFPIKIPLNKNKGKQILIFDRKNSEWLKLEPVIIFPKKEFFSKEEIFEVEDEPDSFGILGTFQVTIQKMDENYLLKIKRK